MGAQEYDLAPRKLPEVRIIDSVELMFLEAIAADYDTGTDELDIACAFYERCRDMCQDFTLKMDEVDYRPAVVWVGTVNGKQYADSAALMPYPVTRLRQLAHFMHAAYDCLCLATGGA